jgi:hypothetical protein
VWRGLPRCVLGREQIKLFCCIRVFCFTWRPLETPGNKIGAVSHCCAGMRAKSTRTPRVLFSSSEFILETSSITTPEFMERSWSAGGGAGRFLHRSFLEDLLDLWEITSEPSRAVVADVMAPSGAALFLKR